MCLAASALAIDATPALAAVFVVNTTADTPDAMPGDGVCATLVQQCSLRAAIQEANAAPGSTINFNILGVPPGSWATIQLLMDLPPIIASGTIVNGFSQPNTNTGQAGSNFRPGVAAGNPCVALLFEKPDVAIDGNLASTGLQIGDDVTNPVVTGVVIRGLAIYDTAIAAVLAHPNTGPNTVEQMFVGVLPSGADPGPERNTGFGVRQLSPGQLTASRSLVGYNGEGGIDGEASATDLTVTQNEVFRSGWRSDDHDGIDLNGINGLAQCNFSYENTNASNPTFTPAFTPGLGEPNGASGNGIEVGSKSRTLGLDLNVVEFNTVQRNQSAGISIRKGPRGNTVRKNVVLQNEVGISVNTERNDDETPRPTNRNVLTKNSIFANGRTGPFTPPPSSCGAPLLPPCPPPAPLGGLGLDLQDTVRPNDPVTGSDWTGPAVLTPGTGRGALFGPDGVTPNDSCDPDGGPAPDGDPANTASNDLQNWPVLTSVTRKGKFTTFAGTLDSTPLTTFVIEFFSTPLSDLSSPDDREGKRFLGSTQVTTSAAPTCRGTFNATLMVEFPADEVVTATATKLAPATGTSPADAIWSTSEFGNRGPAACEDDDDFDSDAKRDDADSDDDNDGRHDDLDSDDDNDGERDNVDSDDDNDCIDDDFDSESKKERQESDDGEVEEGKETVYDLAADSSELFLIVTAEALGEAKQWLHQPLTVEIYDPRGMLIANSPPLVGRVAATAVPAVPGTYKAKIKNAGPGKVRFQTLRIKKNYWLF